MIRLLVVLAFLASPAMATQDAIPGLYAVQGVAADDVLNVRSAPSPSAEILSELGPDATAIEVVALSDDLRWGQINTGERSGWVAMRFLATMPGEYQGRFPSPATCFGTEPFWTLKITEDALRFDRMDQVFAQFDAGHREGALGRRNTWSARAVSEGRGMTVVVDTAACSDGMSDRAYGLTTSVILSQDTQHAHYTGCCSLAP